MGERDECKRPFSGHEKNVKDVGRIPERPQSSY